eukprot:TRINITY_DN58_c0_g1_i6.p2 TRINITY_DN58_c0_g1~~TRINITY_DN58_c0_g1_i6.p2  ORF type:complete len:115 (-),score=37.91 TRINITY_DN58_c0_g1_i6:153-497(-)
MRKLDQNPTDEELRDMIHEVDSDGNGTVDFSEFLQMMKKVMKEGPADAELRAAFDVFDLNHDGFITGEELKKGMATLGETVTTEEVRHMILDADLNNDGKIDFPEFCRMMKAKP